jgi:uncharacterized protein
MTGSSSSVLGATDRTRLKRMPKRGVFDRAAIDRPLDEGFVCHVTFVVGEQPYAIPTGYARVGDAIYLHGSAASRMLRSVSAVISVCVAVTLVDGLVLAGTSVLILPIEEASAKVRTGPPVDDDEDLEWPAWAGVVPLALKVGVPLPDSHLPAGVQPPDPSRVARTPPAEDQASVP